MKYIRILNKKDFNKVMEEYNSNYKNSMWDFCKSKTCYVPSENCFITLEKAQKLNYTEL